MCCNGVGSPVSVLYNSLGQPTDLNPDAFQRLRVSNPSTIFDSKQVYDAEPLFFATSVSGGASIVYTNSRASSALSVVGGASRAIRQTKRYFNYQPGKSFQVMVTFVFTGGGQAGVAKRVGYFDDNNGIFMQMDGTNLSVVIRSNVSGVVVNNVVPRASWSDQLDGTGPSKVTLDTTTAQIFFCDFEWLGVGSVRVGLVINGQFVTVYQFNHANVATSVYMQTPNLPVRWEVQSSGGNGSIEAICCSVNSEGGQDLIGSQRAAVTPTGKSIANGTSAMLMAIRNKTGAYLRSPVIPMMLSVGSFASGQGMWKLQVNPELSGAASWTSVANSAVEVDTARTTVTADGTVLAAGYFSVSNHAQTLSLKEALNVGANIDGSIRDELVLTVTNTATSGTDTYLGSLNWLEPN